MSKNHYRDYFASVAPYVKISIFLKECGIAQSSFSMFMKDELFNYQVSIEKLDYLYKTVKGRLVNFV